MRKGMAVSCACAMLVLTAILLPLTAEGALSLGATPSSLSANLERGKGSDLSLYVINMGTSEINCSVYVDDAYSSWVTFDSADFTLNGNTSRDVTITVNAPANGSDKNTFFVYVVGSSAGGGGTPVSAGLKIPVSLNLTDATDVGGPGDEIPLIYIVGIVVVVAVAIGALAILIRRHG